MNFLKNLFSAKEKPINSYADFWAWFQQHEKEYYKVVKTNDTSKIDAEFFDNMAPKLAELRDCYFYLVGMEGDIAELNFTADGSIPNFVYIEELVAAAPMIAGWRFVAHKDALCEKISDMAIGMQDYDFSPKNINFYANDNTDYPDAIDITITYKDWVDKDEGAIKNGVFIFLENYLGEICFNCDIDEVEIIDEKAATQPLISIKKLPSFINWRQKEFIEKYEDSRHDTENDGYSNIESTFDNGLPIFGVINSDLLKWDGQASHPWIGKIMIHYEASAENGMPYEQAAEVLDTIFDELEEQLLDFEGNLFVARTIGDGERIINYVCNDFRKISKVYDAIQRKYGGQFGITYDIYKDKYWTSFDWFR
jgi:Family of unknown function (DUF695)